VLDRLDAALEGDGHALAEVAGTDVGEPVPRDHGVELGPLLAVADVLVGGDGERRDLPNSTN
jgi:hypothetical protein